MIICFICISLLSCVGLALAFDPDPPGIKRLSPARDRDAKTMEMAAREKTTLAFRGLLIGGDHGTGNIHHDNIYVRIDDGPLMYQTSVPARKKGNLLPDAGLLWHFYSRDNSRITVYGTSAWENGDESELSSPLSVLFSYPSSGCSEQTVPIAVAGPDQLVGVGTEVTLDGSQSFDPHGADTPGLAFRWECYAGPESSVALSDEGRAPLVTFTPGREGNYYFRLTVRDRMGEDTFNRSPVAYVRVAVVGDPLALDLLKANAGRTQQALMGQVVTLDGSGSVSASVTVTYSWVHENPLGTTDLYSMADRFGNAGSGEECYQVNLDGDGDVDGMDMGLLAANFGAIELPDDEAVQFTARIARPHIFRLTISDGMETDSETTIVAVNHGNALPVLTPPPVEESCLN
ncbi:MAG: hypothetical protein GY737_26305 [Desulfobacteraceae bacterium]|nr:hypothetical protein [Desulfobacteraceae bacterium]